MGNSRWKKGKSGNLNGRPVAPPIEKLQGAIKRASRTRHRTVFEHYVNQAYMDNTVLVSLMRKLIPDKKQMELDVDPIQMGIVSVEELDIAELSDTQLRKYLRNKKRRTKHLRARIFADKSGS